MNNDNPLPECYHSQGVDAYESEVTTGLSDAQDEPDPNEVSDVADEDDATIEIGNGGPSLEDDKDDSDITIAIVGGGTVVQCSSQVYNY